MKKTPLERAKLGGWGWGEEIINRKGRRVAIKKFANLKAGKQQKTPRRVHQKHS